MAKYDRENTEALLESAQLELQLGERKKAAEVYQWILDSQNAKSDSVIYMSITKQLAKVRYRLTVISPLICFYGFTCAPSIHYDFLNKRPYWDLCNYSGHISNLLLQFFTSHCTLGLPFN